MTHRLQARHAMARCLAIAFLASLAWPALPARAQGPIPAPIIDPTPAPTPTPTLEPATPVEAPIIAAPPALPAEVQVVRFSAPEGTKMELLGPAPEPILAGPEPKPSALTVGLKVGTTYRLKLTNLPNVAEGAELYPVVEIVGHLHRPPGVDPYKFPIRIEFDEDDFTDASAKGRLVTKVVYLEAPEHALPISLPKDRVPALTLSPVEDPIVVAPKLGRVAAILKIGGRAPTLAELSGEPEWPMANTPCPFAGPDGGKCPVACGPVCGTPPPSGRTWMPRDEFLCDGGDHGNAAAFGGDGGLTGIDPKDAVLQFRVDARPRVLPTNTVCLYAPRFAALRASVGPNETLSIERLREGIATQKQMSQMARQSAKKLTLNQAAELARLRERASGMKGRVYAADHVELRVLQGFDVPTNVAGNVKVQGPVTALNRQQGAAFREKVKLEGIKSAESAVVTGLAEGLGQKVMAWKPQELAGVEVPPNKPGLAVIKQVSASEAEPGDVVIYTIRYRNMGNVPILSVSVVDSLLPRLEYVPASSLGPEGTVFSARPNSAGSTELRWDLPGSIPPGSEGYVQFQARVR